MDDYALYRGDRFVDIGSLNKLAMVAGVSVSTIRFYMSPCHRKRARGSSIAWIVIRIDQGSD